MAEKKKGEHTTFEVGPISESRMREIMEGIWQEDGLGREALAENIRVWYKPELIRKSKAVADSVKTEFLHAWNGYKQYAWGHDDLRPVSRTAYDWYGVPLGLTIVDSLDTLYLLELDEELENAIKWVENNLDFNVDVNVSEFEMTIRWLGGLIAGFLITGSKKLLDLATDLGNRLLPAYGSPTGMPYRFVNLRTGATSGVVTYPDEIGSAILEMGMLSKLTGNPIYYNTAKVAVNAIYTRRSVINLFGSTINVDTGAWVDVTSTIGGGASSIYEYLLKGWLLFKDHDFLDWYSTLVGGIVGYMEEIYNGMMWFRRVNMATGALVDRHTDIFVSSFVGYFALSGRLTEGEQLVRSMYAYAVRWGVSPQGIDYSSMTVVNPVCVISPEQPEVLFWLWRTTGKDEYRMMAYTLMKNVIKYCKVNAGFTMLGDARTLAKPAAGTFWDWMPSYLLAEWMKYLYLTWADSPRINYEEVLFTTEGHLLRGIVPT